VASAQRACSFFDSSIFFFANTAPAAARETSRSYFMGFSSKGFGW
jgi:hypothetical protein